MANEQPIKNYTQADIDAYHQGKLSPAAMNALEKAALEDPFLADALEGYQDPSAYTREDLSDLKNRLANRIEQQNDDKKIIAIRRTYYSWLKIAALFILIAGGGLLVYQLGFNNQEKQTIANKEIPVISKDPIPTNPATSTTESNTIPTTDSLEKRKPASKTTDSYAKAENEVTVQSVPGLITSPPGSQETNKLEEPAKNKMNAGTEQVSTPSNAPPAHEMVTNYQNLSDKQINSRNAEAELKRKSLAKEENKSYLAAESKAFVADSYRSRSNPNSFNVFRGRVTDEANNPLPFVNITNPVDNVGTYSDARGNFTMIYPDTVLNVNVRSLGYLNKNQLVLNRSVDNQVVLKDDQSTLNEVVISTKKVNSKYRDNKNNLVLEEPEPADGWNNYDTYLANNLIIPETYQSKKSAGAEVELSFEVNKQGQPVNIKVEKSLCETCDAEAIRALKMGPKWKRKARKGRTSITISF